MLRLIALMLAIAVQATGLPGMMRACPDACNDARSSGASAGGGQRGSSAPACCCGDAAENADSSGESACPCCARAGSRGENDAPAVPGPVPGLRVAPDGAWALPETMRCPAGPQTDAPPRECRPAHAVDGRLLGRPGVCAQAVLCRWRT